MYQCICFHVRGLGKVPSEELFMHILKVSFVLTPSLTQLRHKFSLKNVLEGCETSTFRYDRLENADCL